MQLGDSDYVGCLIGDDDANHEIVALVVNSDSRNGESCRRDCRQTTVPREYCPLHKSLHRPPHIDNSRCMKAIVNGNGEPALLMGIPSRFALIERLDY